MRKLLTFLVISSILAFLSLSAHAAKLEFDFLTLDSEYEVLDFDTSALQIKFINELSPNIDIEGVLAIGISDDGITVSDGISTVSFEIELENMFGVFLKLHSGNGQDAHQFFGRVGFARMSIDFSAAISDPSSGNLSASDSEDDTGIAFGIGALFSTSETGAFTIEYNQFPDVDLLGNGSDFETSALSIGYVITF